MSYIKNSKNEECNRAVCRIFNNIDINKINNFIDEIPNMSNIRKKFYKEIINYRYEIIENVYYKLNNK